MVVHHLFVQMVSVQSPAIPIKRRKNGKQNINHVNGGYIPSIHNSHTDLTRSSESRPPTTTTPTPHMLCTRMWTRQIWGIWKLRPAYSPETPNLDQNRWCFVPCDLEISWMTLENNRASLLCCFKLCTTFHSHRWIQTGVTVRKRPIWVKFDKF